MLEVMSLMDFDMWYNLTDNGSINSISGDYIGGIAGKSDGTIRRSYAKVLYLDQTILRYCGLWY